MSTPSPDAALIALCGEVETAERSLRALRCRTPAHGPGAGGGHRPQPQRQARPMPNCYASAGRSTATRETRITWRLGPFWARLTAGCAVAAR